MLGSLVAFVDRQVVAIVVGPMSRDLGIGDAQIGWLYGIFALFYAVAGVPIAWLADRYSRKWLIAIGVFLWSLMTVACGLTRNFGEILLARVGVGVGEASITPATVSMVGDLFPREQIPLALSIYQTGAIIGSGLAFVIGGVVLGIVEQAEPMVLPIVGALKPWQQTFVYVGLPGFVLALVILMLREPVRRHLPTNTTKPIPSSSKEEGAPRGFSELRSFYRSHWQTLTLHHLGFLSLALMGYAFVFWTVTYFVRVHGLGAADASQTFGWIFLVAGPMGPILAALLAQRLSKAGRADANIIAGMVGGLLALPVIIAIQFAPSALVAFVLYVPAMVLVNSPFGIANAALPLIAPPQLRAQVAAVNMLVGAVGMMLGPPLAGYFNEQVFPGPEGVRYSLLTLTCIFGFLGVLLLWFCRPFYARSLTQAEAEIASVEAAQDRFV